MREILIKDLPANIPQDLARAVKITHMFGRRYSLYGQPAMIIKFMDWLPNRAGNFDLARLKRYVAEGKTFEARIGVDIWNFV